MKTGSVGSTALLPKQAEATLIPGPSSPSILAGCFKVGTVLGQQVIHDVFGPRGLGVFLTDTAAASGYVIQHAIAETLPDAPKLKRTIVWDAYVDDARTHFRILIADVPIFTGILILRS